MSALSPASVERPPAPIGLRHLALNVIDLPAVERFYVDLLGFQMEWRPDPDSVYLAGHGDSLALHAVKEADRAQFAAPSGNRLDHLGIALHKPEDVDAWHAYLAANGVEIVAAPRTHRDGARSFYCRDPEGNVVQFICHPPIVAWEAGRRGPDAN